MRIFIKITLFLILLIIYFVNYSPTHAGKTNLFKVLRVVDGDTIVVDVRGNRETVRLLGIDTPESVDPRRPVQCFGKAATERMKGFVEGKMVILIDERDTQGNRDRYGRLLRYVYLPDSVRTFVNGEMIKQGYAFSFREYPTKMTEKFNRLERYAMDNNLGLWGSCDISVDANKINGTKRPNKTNNSGDRDCSDFKTRAQAQEYFISKGGSVTVNVDKLDKNRDGMACEGLP